MFRIRIQNISDVITNSSSELFIIKPNCCSVDEAKEFIKLVSDTCEKNYDKDREGNYVKDWKQLEEGEIDRHSGVGGTLDMYDYSELIAFRQRVRYPGYTIEDLANDEKLNIEELDQYLWIDIDWAKRGTIKFITDNFEIIDEGF